MRSAALLFVVVSVVCSACTGSDPVPPATTAPGEAAGGNESGSTTSSMPSPGVAGGDPLFVTTVPGAVAIGLAVGGDEAPVVAWTSLEGVGVARLDQAGALFDSLLLSDVKPFAHPIERPAVGLRPDGTIDLAFTALADGAGSVFYAKLPDDSGARAISGPPRPETNLVHLSYDSEGAPMFAWLEDSTLSVAHGSPDPAEVELVDDLTCDCCNPVPVTIDGLPIVAYRDLDRVDGRVVRDAAVIRSTGTFEEFESPQVIADDHWFIDACPFSGPSAVEASDGGLLVAWMDARQSVHPDQASSTIWVDRSDDGGVTFGTDLAVTTGGLHRWPVIAVDGGGTAHLLWETQGSESGLSYSVSFDSGRTFAEPSLLVDDSISSNPKSPSVVVHEGMLLVSWSDQEQGYVAAWSLDG